MKNITCISILLLFLITNSACLAQTEDLIDISGTWKAIGWKILINTYESDIELAERVTEEHKCLKSIFIIDKLGIHNNGSCGFLGCNEDFSHKVHYSERRIILDNEYTMNSGGFEISDTNIVGANFVRLLDDKYQSKFLKVIDTKCECDYGSFTIKICLLSKTRIALFCGAAIIVLQKQ